MRLSMVRFAALFALFLTTACYQSMVPVGGTAMPVDTNLLGIWEEVEPENSPAIVTIRATGDAEYYVEMPWHRGTHTIMKARASIIMAGGTTFVNLHDVETGEPEILVMRLKRLTDNSISVATLKESVPRFDTAEQLHAYLAAHADDASIIQDELRLRKVSAR
jgi:hypothetical protein